MAPNKNYLRGRRFEYEIIDDFLEAHPTNSFAQRMAGSHSPYDVVGVDMVNNIIHFIQAKTKVGEKLGYEDSESNTFHCWTVKFYKRTKFIRRKSK